MSRNIINDGYTRTGYVEDYPGLYEALEFEYRPMLPNTVNKLEHQIERSPDGGHADIIAAVLANHIVSWSEVDEAGNSVKITMDSIRRLPYLLLLKTQNIIMGVSISDEKPGHAEMTQDDAESIAAAICDGTPPGQQILEDQAKN